MPAKEEGKQVGFRLKPDLYAQLAAIAADRGTSVGNYARDAVLASIKLPLLSIAPLAVDSENTSASGTSSELLAEIKAMHTSIVTLQKRQRLAVHALLIAGGKTEPEEAAAFCETEFGT